MKFKIFFLLLLLLLVNLCLPAQGIYHFRHISTKEGLSNNEVKKLFLEKISLSAGEKQTVSFVVKEDDLKFYDEGWKTEPGSFTLYIGSSSADIRGKAKFTLLVGNK